MVDPSMDAAIQSLYENLRSVYISAGHDAPNQSVFLGLMAMGSKSRRMRVLLDAAVPARALGSAGADLVAAGLADYASADKRITLSSLGIWEAEQARDTLDSDRLLAFIDEKWFDLFAESKSLPTDKEKLVLFTLLAGRTFSAGTAVDLSHKRAHGPWTAMTLASEAFLRDRGIIKDDHVTEALRNEGTGAALPPVVKFYRYTENLPKKTEGLYAAKGNNKYYLDLEPDAAVAQVQVSYLFKLVLGDQADFTLAEAITDFCRDRAYDIAIRVFPQSEPNFASLDYDRLIETALRNLVLER
jgi:hypothetical protein